MIMSLIPLENLSFTDIILLVGIIGIGISKVGEGRGWFKTSTSLRVENTDLIRRNGELESAVERHEATLAENKREIEKLKNRIIELEKLDQSAVLLALRQHELGAESRAEKTQGAIAESTSELRKIATLLESNITQ